MLVMLQVQEQPAVLASEASGPNVHSSASAPMTDIQKTNFRNMCLLADEFAPGCLPPAKLAQFAVTTKHLMAPEALQNFKGTVIQWRIRADQQQMLRQQLQQAVQEPGQKLNGLPAQTQGYRQDEANTIQADRPASDSQPHSFKDVHGQPNKQRLQGEQMLPSRSQSDVSAASPAINQPGDASHSGEHLLHQQYLQRPAEPFAMPQTRSPQHRSDVETQQRQHALLQHQRAWHQQAQQSAQDASMQQQQMRSQQSDDAQMHKLASDDSSAGSSAFGSQSSMDSHDHTSASNHSKQDLAARQQESFSKQAAGQRHHAQAQSHVHRLQGDLQKLQGESLIQSQKQVQHQPQSQSFQQLRLPQQFPPMSRVQSPAQQHLLSSATRLSRTYSDKSRMDSCTWVLHVSQT